MTGGSPPKAPASAVSTSDLSGAWGNANEAIGAAGNNAIPENVWSQFSPELMSSVPYGYDPRHAVDMGNMWSSMGPNMFAAGDAAINAGMDPQHELYNRTAGQVQDQTRAAQYARGIQTTPYGASGEAGNMANFNIDWQNNQLSRILQGIQGGATAYGAGGNAISGGQALASGVPQNMATYAAGLQQLGMNTTVPEQWQAGAYSNLFGAGSGAQNANYQNQVAAWKAKQDSDNAFWGGIGKLGGSLVTAPMTGGGSLAGNMLL